MISKEAVLLSLRSTPPVIMELVRSAPEQILKIRPAAGWSIHEHACHLAFVQPIMMDRLDLILRSDKPHIRGYQPGQSDDPDGLLQENLTDSLRRFITDRHAMTERIENLTDAEWTKEAVHEEYKAYSVAMMFRHLSMHDYLHAYRIEQLLIEKEGPFAIEG